MWGLPPAVIWLGAEARVSFTRWSDRKVCRPAQTSVHSHSRQNDQRGRGGGVPIGGGAVGVPCGGVAGPGGIVGVACGGVAAPPGGNPASPGGGGATPGGD